jgi:hypothetical protein
MYVQEETNEPIAPQVTGAFSSHRAKQKSRAAWSRDFCVSMEELFHMKGFSVANS